MGSETKIEWCDSTVNPTMGCDGCELWNRAAGVDHCYAGNITDRYAGSSKGFPVSFDTPEIFPGRIEQAIKWSDLTGTRRFEKPWLNGMPRLIFVGDMGDTFSESLGDPMTYLAPLVELMAGSPHQWLMLTKRPSRMAEFSKAIGGLPKNVWPGTTITSQVTTKRIDHLLTVEGGGPKWISAEPLLGAVDLTPHIWKRCPSGCSQSGYDSQPGFPGGHRCTTCHSSGTEHRPGYVRANGIDWVITGGESGPNARIAQLEWYQSLRDQCEAAGVPFFHKQHGEWCAFSQLPQSTLWSVDLDRFPCKSIGDHSYHRVGKKLAGRLLDGQEWSQYPEVAS